MEKKIFLTVDTYQLNLDGSEACNDIIATHSTSEDFASTLDYSMMLLFEDSKLVKTFNTGKKFRKKNKEIDLPEGFENVKFEETLHLPQNIRFSNKETESYLGGRKPIKLVIPQHGVVSFQYLGFISKKELIFSGNSWDLDLIFPIYSNVEKVFIDYSNPLKPTVLNINELENADTSHEEYINTNTEIEYVKHSIEFYEPEKNKKRGFCAGYSKAGIPRWLQNPYIPHCPKTGNRMKFLMQIDSAMTAAMPIKYSNVALKGTENIEKIGYNGHIDVIVQKVEREKYYHKLNFWGDGALYIFFEPETKVVCYFIQNT